MTSVLAILFITSLLPRGPSAGRSPLSLSRPSARRSSLSPSPGLQLVALPSFYDVEKIDMVTSCSPGLSPTTGSHSLFSKRQPAIKACCSSEFLKKTRDKATNPWIIRLSIKEKIDAPIKRAERMTNRSVENLTSFPRGAPADKRNHTPTPELFRSMDGTPSSADD